MGNAVRACEGAKENSVTPWTQRYYIETATGHHHLFNTTDLEMIDRGNFGSNAMEAADEQFLKQPNWRQQVLLLTCLHLHDGNNDENNR